MGVVHPVSDLTPEERARLEQRLLSGGPPVRRTSVPRRQLHDPCPLSFGQQRLWFLERLEPGPTYNMPWGLRLSGGLDVEALRKALNTILQRHEVLRTRFPATAGGEPTQVVVEGVSLTLEEMDLSSMPEADREAEARRILQEEARRAFELAADLLVRARLLRLDTQEHILLLVMHHIVCDGWSRAILVRELTSLYQAFHASKPSPLPEVPIQYADFALWQRRTLEGENLQKEIAYWREHLAGAPPLLDLPTDRPRPATLTYRGAHLEFEVPEEIAGQLKALGRSENATLFITLLTAFQVLLSRCTGQEDVVVGTALAGRSRVETEGLIGFFVNTLPLRTVVSGTTSFRQLLARVARAVLGALAHQDLPFEKLVEELHPQRSLSHAPLFQVLFNFHNVPRESLQLPGLTIRTLEVDTRIAKYDLSLTLADRPDGILGGFTYNADLLDRETVVRLAARFRCLLEGIAAEADARVCDLPLLPEAEERQVVQGWNATATPYPREATIHGLFEAQAARIPDAVALAGPTGSMTYRQLNERANQLAHHLRARGVGPEAAVAVCLERSPDLIVALLAVLKAGGAYVPLDPTYPRQRLAFFLEDTRAAVLVTKKDLAANLPPAAHVVCLDTDRATIAAWPRDNPDAGVRAEGLAYVIYTSGTTGTPKGVAVVHRGVVRLVQQTNYVDLNEREVLIHLSAVTFDASTFEIWGALLNGGRLVVAPPGMPSPGELGQLLRDGSVTTLWLTAGLFHQVIESAPEVLRPVRQLLAGGDVLSSPHVRKALEGRPGVMLINGYGPTENTTFTCCHRLTAAAQVDTNVPIGSPIANTTVYLLDAYLRPVPIGTPGELYIGGAGLARGYLGRPDLTAEKFVPDPFAAEPGARLYRTGDRARWLADGSIEFLGRVDRQVKVRGFRVELEEIEAVLKTHPAVRDCAVIARPHEGGDKQLVAYVVADAADLGPELIHFAGQELPGFMVPAAVVGLKELPLTAHGKVNRAALPAPGAAPAGGMPPRDALETQLVMLWEEVLGRRPIGVQDNFFEVGGHSLLAARLFARIEAVLGQTIPLRVLFQAPTVAGLAELLRRKVDSGAWPTLVPVQAGGTGRPIFCVAKPAVNPLGYAFLARHMGPDQPLYVLQSSQFRKEEEDAYREEEFVQLAAEYVRAMRAVQPSGPYLLAGFCEGAHIAFHMARQLQAEGLPVGLLAILDAWPVENTRSRLLWKVRVVLRSLSQFGHLSRQQKAERVRRWIRRVLGPLARRSEVAAAAAPRPAEVVFARRYFPGPDWTPPTFEGKIVVFRVRKQPYWRIRDRNLGWSRWATQGVEVHVVPGEHATLLREPNVQILAARLGECIARADSR
jgi:aspartate racemase